jgi:hypothetical protein
MSELWDATAEKFRKVTDRIGRPIDDGIFDTVVALNALGITTSASCEGHLDHGLSHPWIDVQLSELTDFYTPEMAQMSEDIRKMRVRLCESYTPEMRQLQEEWERMRSGERLKLFSMLADFYKDRVVSYDRMITFSVLGRIRSQGGDYLSLLPEDERALRMKDYQQEMRAFTEFLKSIYVSREV